MDINITDEHEIIIIDHSNLTALPDNLPENTGALNCAFNELTYLPNNLPSQLQALCCNNNQLIALPDKLPSNLSGLWFHNNNITVLPDLPNTIKYMSLYDNPLEANYPRIFTFDETKDIIEYINLYNAIRRKKEWLAKVNAGNPLLERYMQRMMHPSRLEALKADPNIDVEEYITRYVDSL